MIRLSLLDGTPILINPRAIFGMRSADGGTAITSESGDQVVVKQSLKELEKRFAAAATG